MPAEFRQNIALYNPKKGLEELKPLIGQADWLKWIPLAGLTEEQMAAIMGVAKVYVVSLPIAAYVFQQLFHLVIGKRLHCFI